MMQMDSNAPPSPFPWLFGVEYGIPQSLHELSIVELFDANPRGQNLFAESLPAPSAIFPSEGMSDPNCGSREMLDMLLKMS